MELITVEFMTRQLEIFESMTIESVRLLLLMRLLFIWLFCLKVFIMVLLNMMESRLVLPFSRLFVIFVLVLFESWITLLMMVQLVFTALITVEFITTQFVRLLLKMLLSTVTLNVSFSAKLSPIVPLIKVALTILVNIVPLFRVWSETLTVRFMNLLVPPVIFPRRKVVGDMFAGGIAVIKLVPSGRMSVMVTFAAIMSPVFVTLMV